MRNPNRPLSPHLTVYRMHQLTSLLSVVHRGTGVFITIAALLLVGWLMAMAAGAEAYATFNAIAGHWFGQLVLLGVTFSVAYHLCNGIRHLVWDTGRGFELSAVYRGGYIVVAVSILLTILVWVVAYAGRF